MHGSNLDKWLHEKICSRNRKLVPSWLAISAITIGLLVWNGYPSFTGTASNSSHDDGDRRLGLVTIIPTCSVLCCAVPRLIGCLRATVRGALLLAQNHQRLGLLLPGNNAVHQLLMPWQQFQLLLQSPRMRHWVWASVGDDYSHTLSIALGWSPIFAHHHHHHHHCLSRRYRVSTSCASIVTPVSEVFTAYLFVNFEPIKYSKCTCALRAKIISLFYKFMYAKNCNDVSFGTYT